MAEEKKKTVQRNLAKLISKPPEERPPIPASSPSKASETVNVKIEAGNMAFLEKNYHEALNMFQAALKLAPDDPRVLSKVAQALYKLKEYPRAIQTFKKVLEIDPNDKDIIFNLGLVYFQSGDKAEALRVYDRLKKLHPDRAESLYKIIYSTRSA